jgi:rhamnosyl/mannosyltransferase
VGSGPEENDIKKYIANNALDDDILVLPHQPENIYRVLFSLADCFVLPSTHQTEAFGIVLTEAMASGTPIISTELGTGTSWVNQNGETGIVVPPQDSSALAKAIVYLAEHSDERKSMSVKSLARAKRFFEEEMMLDAYSNIIDN